MNKNLRLGTRGSPLALIQAQTVRDRLVEKLGKNGPAIEIIPIKTSGDWRPEQKEASFLETGGDKGLFVKELEEALLAGTVDFAVHSLKDMPGILPERLTISAVLERADPRDVFVSLKASSLDALPAGSIVGTCSLRRQAQILSRRPDLHVTPLRGNVDTRLRKLEKGDADATILALAGLERLGAAARATAILDTTTMLPAVGQGVIAIESRREDTELSTMLAAINHGPTSTCVVAERGFLATIEGSCRTPIGGLAVLEKGELKLDVLAARPDGTDIMRLSWTGAPDRAETVGRELGEELKSRLPPDFFVAST